MIFQPMKTVYHILYHIRLRETNLIYVEAWQIESQRSIPLQTPLSKLHNKESFMKKEHKLITVTTKNS